MMKSKGIENKAVKPKGETKAAPKPSAKGGNGGGKGKGC